VKGIATARFFSAGVATTNDSAFGGYQENFDCFNRTGGSLNCRLVTTSFYRDPSAWFHVVFVWNTTSSTASDRAQIWVNGARVTNFTTATYPPQNTDSHINNSVAQYIGSQDTSQYFAGLLADIHFIDGQALDPTSFGEFSATTGVWVPKAYTGTYGTNGFHLDFSNNASAAALGTDTSGNGNTWTVNNISVNTGAISSPVRFAWSTTGSGWTLSNSNYTASYTRTTTYTKAYSAALDGSTTYRFYLRQTPGDNVGGWFFADTNSVADTHPDQLGGNSLGMRNGESTIGTYGTFATANGTSSGQDQITGLSSITASSGSTTYSEWVVNMTARKVWVRNAGDSTWLKGGDPSNSSSTPTFYLASGTVYFGYVGYDGTGISSFDTFVPSIAAGNDSLVDVPTSTGTDTGVGGEVRGNYCTLNPVDKGSIVSLTQGNLEFTMSGITTQACRSTIGVSSGKWYWEILISTLGAGAVGISGPSDLLTGDLGDTGTQRGLRLSTGLKTGIGATAGTTSTFSSGDIAGLALNMDAGELTIYKNGSTLGVTHTGISGITIPTLGMHSSASSTLVANFGQRPFAYTAPSGFKALCTANLPAPVVTKPSTVMDVALYTGTGSAQTVSGLGFSPDLVWIKSRSQAFNHGLYDTVRGATNRLISSSTAAEDTLSGVTAFNSNGFTMGGADGTNGSTYTYAAWTWDAGSSTVTNTQGSISSQVRANASAGFSIVSWVANNTAGATVGHGLGVAPSMVIVKNRSNAYNWSVYHASLTSASYVLTLNSTSAQVISTEQFNGVAPSSTVITLGANGNTNYNSGNNIIAYCFAPVAGYSSFGSYVGNGSSDGVFVYTGHRVKYLMVKRTDSTGDWFILDGVREPYNYVSRQLGANNSGAESGPDAYNVDFTSNGFKIRNSVAGFNASSGSYVYISFAEHPFQYARAR
jgi:hypothetical protein